MLLLCAAVDGSRRRAREGGGAIRAAVWAEALVREASMQHCVVINRIATVIR